MRSVLTGVCKLCLKEAVLKKSHIIPKKYFNKIRDENGAYFEISKNGERPYNYDYKEKLLCGECENLLNKNYEQYGNHMFDRKPPYRSDKELRIMNYNHDVAYLYYWSIFWRASVSTHDIFEKIRAIIPPNMKESIRCALLLGRIPTIPDFGRLDKVVKLRIFKVELPNFEGVIEQIVPQPATSGTGVCLMLLGFLIEISFDRNQGGDALSRKNNKVCIVGRDFALSHKYLRSIITGSGLNIGLGSTPPK
jgi:hypothetical protein